jgi:phosphatidylserine synthase
VAAGLGLGAIAVLMVSRFRYRSFREIDLRSRRSYRWVLPLAAVLVAVAVHPESALLVLAALYLASAPAAWIRDRLGGRAPQADGGVEVADEPVVR